MIKSSDIPRVNVLGVGVSALNLPIALQAIEALIASQQARYITVVPVHSIMDCQRDPTLRRIHNRAALVTPDGMPLVWLCRLHGQSHVRRVYGPDLMLAACNFGLEKRWRHYFYGGAPGVPELLAQKLSAFFPGLQVVGVHSPPFHLLSEAEDAEIVEMINSTRPDIVWAGLGSPKQEYWMAEHLDRIQAPLMIGVGAAFDFLAGVKKQAPHWMQRSGLEWVFRLFSEPCRLWKRYLINNPLFVLLVIAQTLHIKKFTMD